MAKTNLYQLWDKESESVIGPVVADVRHAPAVRTFHEILANEKTVPGQYPEHFNLLWLGTQDTETALITPNSDPIPVVARGEDWVKARAAAAKEAYDR